MRRHVLRVIFLLLVIGLGYGLVRVQEGFVNPTAATTVFSKEMEAVYHKFVAFYNPFMDSWEKAITTAVGLERPAPKEGDPVPTFRREDLNQYIGLLSQKLDTPLPEVTAPLPETIRAEGVDTVTRLMTTTPPQAYVRALEWVNARLRESQEKLAAAQKGGGAEGFAMPPRHASPQAARWAVEGFQPQAARWAVEGYADGGATGSCSAFAACLQDPAFLDQLTAAQAKRSATQSATAQNDLLGKMNAVLGEGRLAAEQQTHASLRAATDRVQNQAQSGDLLASMDLPTEPVPKITLPAGADALDRMKKEDPAKYKEYQLNQRPLLEMKQLFSQINANLR